jgi:hypothetical protein
MAGVDLNVRWTCLWTFPLALTAFNGRLKRKLYEPTTTALEDSKAAMGKADSRIAIAQKCDLA